MRRNINPFLWNALIGAVIFLPLYLLVRGFQLFFQHHQNPLEGGGLGYAIIEYIGLSIYVWAGTVMHTLALRQVPQKWLVHRRRLIIALSAFMLPATALLKKGSSLLLRVLPSPVTLPG